MTSAHSHTPFFFLQAGQLCNGHLTIEGSDARHLSTVRRARPGQRIFAGDGRGVVIEAELDSVDPRRVEARVVGSSRTSSPRPKVTVAQAASRAAKLDGTIAKLVELGIDEIVIFAASRSIVRWDEAKKGDLAARWAKIAYEAAKQSRRPWLPSVQGPVALREIVGGRAGLTLVTDAEAGRGMRSVLERDNQSEVTIIVGPEGGLSPEEIEQCCSLGAEAVSIGPGILRTETAGLVAAAAVMYHFGRLGG